MTELRDARLKRALDAAGDDPARPADATRAAVHDAAHRAAQGTRMPWWRAPWSAGANPAPWNAAFATVLVAVLVVVIWQGREPPDAAPEGDQAQAPALQAQPPAAEPARSAPPGTPAQPQPQRAEKSARPAAATDAAAPQSAGQSAAAAAPAAPAAAPPAAAPAARLSRQPAASAPALPWESWSELRIAVEGREVVLARHRAPELAELLNRAARSAQEAPAAAQEPPPGVVVYELSTRGTLLAVLELRQDQLRFLPVGESGPRRSARLGAAELRTLREQTERLLPPK